jgi:2-oxoisovalerate dehydrogenase E1 component beta subunit
VYVARDAADLLEKEGISVEILDLRTVLPLDEEAILASARKTSKVILLHEDVLSGGVGGEIAARIAEKAFDALDGPVVRIAAADTPVPYSPPLEEAFLPNVPRVVEKARWLYGY